MSERYVEAWLVHTLSSGGEEKTCVYAEVQSTGQEEYFKAAQAGMKPKYKLRLWVEEYDDQAMVDIGDVRYTIYRTYCRDGSERMELYLSAKAGVRGG